MASTPSMSVDTDTLGKLYSPFQPAGLSSPWNMDDGKTAYFVSQGSEYELGMPTFTQGTLTVDIQDAINSLVINVNTVVNQRNQDLANKLNDWAATFNNMAVGTTTPWLMTVSSTMTHIRNNEGNDTATLTYVFAWCDPIGLPVLVLHQADIDWAGTPEGGLVVASFAKATTQDLNTFVKVAAMFGADLGELIPGLQFLTVAAVALSVVVIVGKIIIAESDDGGRLNFLGVLSHAVNRISACVCPNATPTTTIPIMDGGAFDSAWVYLEKQSTVDSSLKTPYAEGIYYGTYPADSITYFYSNDYRPTIYKQPYGMVMPELSWGMGTVPFVFATSKVYSDSQKSFGDADYSNEKMYALAILFYCPGGNGASFVLQCISGSGNGDYVFADPTWRLSSSDTPTKINGDVASDVEQKVRSTGAFSTASCQLTYVLPEILQQMCDAIYMGTGTGYGPDGTGPQPKIPDSTLSLHSATQFDTGVVPAVVVHPDGTVLSVHDDQSAVIGYSHLYWHRGSIHNEDNVVTWESGGGHKFVEASWPALISNPSESWPVMEFHTYSNDILWSQTGSDLSNISFSSPFKIGGGDHAAAHIGPDNVVVVIFASGNNYLSYGTAIYQNGWLCQYSAAWNPIGYTAGDYPAVLRSGTTVLEVHNESQHIYFNTGTMDSGNNGITWNSKGPYPLCMAGSHPHLADFGNGYFLLTYDNNGKLYAATGKIDSTANCGIRWYQINLDLGVGHYPAVAAIPSRRYSAVICYNESSGDGNLYSVVVDATFPN